MSHFPDTSFLCALYRPQVQSPLADRYMSELSGFLQVSTLLVLEFRQSIRLQIRLHHQDHKKGFSSAYGVQMMQDFQSDLSTGVLKPVVVDWPEVHLLAEGLSARYTTKEGHRFADILHVATAIHLGVEQFLTFDANQRKLAKAEGLKISF